MTAELDFNGDAFKELIKHAISGGVSGVFIIGTNGECASLTNDIRLNIIDTAVGTISNRVPVFVNISTSSYLETLQLADQSKLPLFLYNAPLILEAGNDPGTSKRGVFLSCGDTNLRRTCSCHPYV